MILPRYKKSTRVWIARGAAAVLAAALALAPLAPFTALAPSASAASYINTTVPSNTALTSGLVLQYSFDNTKVSATAITDESGNGKNGTPSPSATPQVLVVAGGGGGGGGQSGIVYDAGGGGGEVIYNAAVTISVQAYTVTVGGGGNGCGNCPGGNGVNSVFSTITSRGGAGGGTVTNGKGGKSGNTTYDGGINQSGSAAGGGGGNGQAGSNGVTTAGGKGGDGTANSISGSSVYYGGGGGGRGSSTDGAGGAGGGGAGQVAGTVNSGGGGGGSANAGSGIVIISYPTGGMSATGGTITTSGGNRIHTFTSSGTFTVTSTGSISRTPGRIGQAIKFDGITASTTVGNVSSTVKSVAFWARAATSTTQQNIIDLNGSGANIEIVNGAVTANGFTSPTIYVDGAVTSTLNDKNWHHVVVTTGTNVNASNVNLGVVGGVYYGGALDDLRLYNRALSASEVTRLYHLGATSYINTTVPSNAALASGLVLRYSFDKTNVSATAITDESGNGKNGTPSTASSTVFLTSGTLWTVPLDWNSNNNTIEVIGGGAGGTLAVATQGGGGGGGYSKITNAALSTGANVTYAVGSGGGAATAGGDTYFCNSSSNCANISGTAVVIGAKGGNTNSGTTGGTGGQASSGTGSTKYSGGNGGNAGVAKSGGGGGAGGPLGAGGNGGNGLGSGQGAGGGGGNGGGSVGQNGTASAGGGGGNNNGGTGGGTGATVSAASTAGSNGGGGGGAFSSTNTNGSNGGAGTEWDSTHGSGGGGGAGNAGTDVAGNAALYGGGGGTRGASGGAGAQGIIVIKYRGLGLSRTPGRIGQAIKFDGITASTTVGNVSSTVKSVAFWAKVATSTTQQNIIDLNGSGANIEIVSGAVTANGFTSPTIYVDGAVSSVLNDRNWHHVVVTTGTAVNASNVNLGVVGGNYYGGSLDDLRLYNRAFSASEVTRLYHLGATSYINTTVPSNAALASGLQLFYSFDNTKVNVQTGAITDESGNGKTGTYKRNGTASATSTPGRIGQAISFNGITASTTVGNVSSTVKSVAFWAKVATSTTQQNIIDLNGSGANIEIVNGVVTANGFTSPTIYVDGAVTSTLNDKNWHHVVVTTGTNVNASNVNLGVVGGVYYGGALDDLRMYNRALSASEVTRLYHLGN